MSVMRELIEAKRELKRAQEGRTTGIAISNVGNTLYFDHGLFDRWCEHWERQDKKLNERIARLEARFKQPNHGTGHED